MIFIDLQNFELSCKSVDTHLMLDYYKIPSFLLKYATKKYNWYAQNPYLVRAYAYTGEYTSSLMEQLKKSYGGKSEEYQKYLDSAKKQKRVASWFDSCDFFELKLKPLKLRDNSPKQKGIDVQMAVDLVSHAYQDNYDAAIICSGDADLLESIRLVKNLGKIVIIVSKIAVSEGDETTLAFAIRKDADSIIDLGKFSIEDFRQFSHIYADHSK